LAPTAAARRSFGTTNQLRHTKALIRSGNGAHEIALRSDCSPGSGAGADEAVAADTAINADNVKISFMIDVLLFFYCDSQNLSVQVFKLVF
jgi:hypothetical protein